MRSDAYHKRSEKIAAEEFAVFLRDRGRACSFRRGDNSPDWEFTVGEESWAVEVTELHQQVMDPQGNIRSYQSIVRGLQDMSNKIGRQVEGKTARHYQIVAQGPISPSDRRRVVTEAVNHIWSEQTEESRLGPGGQVSIRCFDGESGVPGAISFLLGLRSDLKSGDGASLRYDLQKSVKFSIEQCLKKKVPRLGALRSFDRRVLLMWSELSVFSVEELVKSAIRLSTPSESAIDGIVLFEDGFPRPVLDPDNIFASTQR